MGSRIPLSYRFASSLEQGCARRVWLVVTYGQDVGLEGGLHASLKTSRMWLMKVDLPLPALPMKTQVLAGGLFADRRQACILPMWASKELVGVVLGVLEAFATVSLSVVDTSTRLTSTFCTVCEKCSSSATAAADAAAVRGGLAWYVLLRWPAAVAAGTVETVDGTAALLLLACAAMLGLLGGRNLAGAPEARCSILPITFGAAGPWVCTHVGEWVGRSGAAVDAG